MTGRSKTRARAPTAASQEGIFVLGPLDTIEDVDEKGCALLGYSKAELIGRHGSEIVPPERHFGVAVALDRMRHGDLTTVAAGVMMRKDGSQVRVEVTVQKRDDQRLVLRVRPVPAR